MLNLLKSKELYKDACKVIPGGVSSNNRASSKPFPLFYEKGIGSHIWDVDGNEYIDYMLGRGPLILGHSPKPVIDAIHKQAEKGLFFAGQIEEEVILAEKLIYFIPCAEMVRFCNSGSEAVHAALRLARASTGKKKIIKFEGHYHGWYNNIAWGFNQECSISPMSLGQSGNELENLIIIPWNDHKTIDDIFKQHHNEIAGVITEPVMFNGYFGGIFPKNNFLSKLRALCDKFNALLIFDEIITGFRFSKVTAQEHFQVTPDLATFAKALGAGVPISALVGKKQYMAKFAELTTVHTGTYNAYPISICASLAAINELTKNDCYILKNINYMGECLKSEIEKIANNSKYPIKIRGIGSAFTISFNENDDIENASQAAVADKKRLHQFCEKLHDRYVRIAPEGLFYVSAMHTKEDIEYTVNAVNEVLNNDM